MRLHVGLVIAVKATDREVYLFRDFVLAIVGYVYGRCLRARIQKCTGSVLITQCPW